MKAKLPERTASSTIAEPKEMNLLYLSLLLTIVQSGTPAAGLLFIFIIICRFLHYVCKKRYKVIISNPRIYVNRITSINRPVSSNMSICTIYEQRLRNPEVITPFRKYSPSFRTEIFTSPKIALYYCFFRNDML